MRFAKARWINTPKAQKAGRAQPTLTMTFWRRSNAGATCWRVISPIEIKTRELTESQLNYAVQMTIDRIVFLRIAEERGMEEYGRLQVPHPTLSRGEGKIFIRS